MNKIYIGITKEHIPPQDTDLVAEIVKQSSDICCPVLGPALNKTPQDTIKDSLDHLISFLGYKLIDPEGNEVKGEPLPVV